MDAEEIVFGFRWFKWTADEGFFLNGQHYYFRGANVHQDQAGWGDAVTDAAAYRDVCQMKEAGFDDTGVSDELKADYRSMFEKMLKSANYKVKEAKETEDDEFTVTVEVCPFTAFSTVSDELDQWVTDTYSNVETIPSDEELNEAIMRKMYEIMSAKLADPTYGDKMEKEVHVKVNKDGAYYIPNDDLTAVDDALFPQNQL